MARMKIDTGIIEANDFKPIKEDVGSSALKNLMDLVIDFYEENKLSKEVNDKLKTIKNNIVEVMQTLDIKKIEHKGVKCTLSERTNRDINTDGLLEYCKTLNVDGLVKTVEVVDMDVLENLIYLKKIDEGDIKPFITESISRFPKVSGELHI